MNFRLLPYPLNVYAQTLALEYGSAEHLHFGVFAAALDEAYPYAQQRAQDLLKELLISAPACVLEVGCGGGALARELAAQGYIATAMSGNAAEFESLIADTTQHVCADFQNYQPQQLFDIVVFQQSAQYLDPIILLEQAKACLREGGQLLIADEFLLDDSHREAEPLSLLGHFLQLAVRCGFHITHQQELGTLVAPGLARFHALLLKHEQALCDSLRLEARSVQQLAESLLSMQHKFTDARLGYTLLDLRRGPFVEYDPVFGNIHGFTTDEVCSLFESSFNGPFDVSVWHWKYGTGRGLAVSARVGGKLVGHYGGAPRDILYFGKPDMAVQICDVMVTPEHRSFAGRDTLFFKTAATFLEQHIGNAAQHLLGFGFPNKRVLQVAVRLGLYDVTDSFVEVHYPKVAHNTGDWELAEFDLDSPRSRMQVDALWLQMAAGLQDQIVGVRDWAYLHYRYRAHPLWPSGGYNCLALRRSSVNEPAAVLVLKKHDNAMLLMDIIGPVTEFPALLEVLIGFLARTDETLACRITKGQLDRISLGGCEVRDLEIDIPCNNWTHGPNAQTLAGAWWLTAGDMDFF
ncbi:MAG: GNAT family N-acetyltransferase [Gammaproteobacteria bacterium]|nr:GNAT family N-acetyltransferase [Gammaproteobacteria bacterium]MDP2140802.1 GNAT family N-acetyltransferase [Gammaproteobacteria bacterium]MDP2347548.1 GNAT family N-acetyltransferase [Gammaproteobacteria bacterium]